MRFYPKGLPAGGICEKAKAFVSATTERILGLGKNINQTIENDIIRYKNAKIGGEDSPEKPEMKIGETIRQFDKMEPGRLNIQKGDDGDVLEIQVKTGDILQVDGEPIYADAKKREVLDNITKYKYALERAEIQDKEKIEPYKDYSFSYDFKLPKNFPVIDNRLVIGQWKQFTKEGVTLSPLVCQRFRDGQLTLTVNNSGDIYGKTAHTIEQNMGGIDILGNRVHMEYTMRFSDKEDGYLKVKMNGKDVLNTNIPLYNKNTDYFKGKFYFKFGLFRDNYKFSMAKLEEIGVNESRLRAMNQAMKNEKNGQPMTIYFKNYKVEKL